MSLLNTDQINAAAILKMQHPPVLPGTCVIPNDAQRKEWYDKVVAEMERRNVSTGEQIKAFCDIAGVPD